MFVSPYLAGKKLRIVIYDDNLDSSKYEYRINTAANAAGVAFTLFHLTDCHSNPNAQKPIDASNPRYSAEALEEYKRFLEIQVIQEKINELER